MADVASASERPDAALIAALEAANIHPLWDRYKRITPLHPNADDQPFHWRWSEIEPFTLRALKEVAIEDIERRALIMCNAAFGGQTVTTRQSDCGVFRSSARRQGGAAPPCRRGDPIRDQR